ncbi:hypothetical protein QYF36_026653 [Acer negundo]|nr:hypothetical protein QYF36_026653 [Acer negundo]
MLWKQGFFPSRIDCTVYDCVDLMDLYWNCEKEPYMRLPSPSPIIYREFMTDLLSLTWMKLVSFSLVENRD